MLWVLWKVRVEKKVKPTVISPSPPICRSTKLLDSDGHCSDFLKAGTAVWQAEPLPLSLQEMSLALHKQDFCHFVSRVPGLFSNNVWHLSAYQTNHQGNRQPRHGRRAFQEEEDLWRKRRDLGASEASLHVGDNMEVSGAVSQPSNTPTLLKCSLRTGRMARWVGEFAVQARGSEFKSPALKPGFDLAPCNPSAVMGRDRGWGSSLMSGRVWK